MSAAEALAAWSDRVDVVTARPQDPDVPATALLLRPDTYVAWASAAPRPDGAELGALRDAASRWFGAVAPPGRATARPRT